MLLLRRPYLFSLSLLAFTFLLSLAIGSVSIPLAVLARLIVERLPGIVIQPTWPETFQAILYQIRRRRS